MQKFEATTLGEALGAAPIDENAITELSAEYLMMVHGGNSPYVTPDPSPAWDTLLMNWWNRVSAVDGSQLLRIPILTNVIFPPRPTA